MNQLRKLRLRLRTKLTILLVVTAVIPLVIASGTVISQMQTSERQAALALSTQVGSNAATQIRDFIDSQFGILDDIGHVLETSDIGSVAQTESQSHLLERFLYGNTYFYDLTLVDAHGKEIVRENRQQVFVQNELGSRADAPEFKAVKTEGYYLSPEFLLNGRSYFVLGRAVYNLNNDFIGATFVEIDARLLQQVVQNISALYEGERIFLIDTNRDIIAHPDISQVLGARKASYLPDSIFKSDAGNEYRNDLMKDVIGTAVPVTLTLQTKSNTPLSTNWFVIAEQESAIALAPVQQITDFSLLILVLAIVTIGIISFFSSRHVVKPIEAIHAVAQAYGAGKLEERVTITSHDEIGDLASGFNTMAGQLGDSITALRQDRERVTAIITNLSDGLIEHTKDNEILLINPTAARLLGVEATAMLHRHFGNTSFAVDSKLPSPGEENLQKLFTLAYTSQPLEEYIIGEESVISAFEAEEQPSNELRLEILKPAHRFVSVTSLSYFLTENGVQQERFLKIIHDITREHIISQMKSEFISIAAHQLRTPLTEIKWAVRSVLDGDIGKLNLKQEELLNKAYSMNTQLVRLVGDLLNVTRIEEGRFGYVFKEGDLLSLMEDILKNLKLHFTEKRINLSFTPPPSIPLAFFDSEKIEIVLSNIIDNALNYTPSGGTVTIVMSQEGDYAHISVSDTGIGIPREDMPRIFSKFFRAKNAIKLQTQGSGLGLFMVKHIIETHGGKITIESEEGEGTKVSFTLPLRREGIPPQNLPPLGTAEQPQISPDSNVAKADRVVLDNELKNGLRNKV